MLLGDVINIFHVVGCTAINEIDVNGLITQGNLFIMSFMYKANFF